MEQKRRSIVKTLSWRLWATIITTLVVYFIKGEWSFAVEVGILDTTIKLGAYFYHERVWNKINYGREIPTKAGDFEI